MAGPHLGVVAGGGDLPRRLAEAARGEGRNVTVIGVDGFGDPDLATAFGGRMYAIGQIGAQVDALKAAGCKEVVFAGIVRRPDFSKLRPDVRGALHLPRLIAAATQGDDALLRAVAAIFEGEGFRVVGADDVVADLLAPAGALGACIPSQADMSDLVHAARVAAQVGALDIGQGAVVCAGVVLAVEAQEGTDQMLSRVAGLSADIRGTPAERRGVLMKRPKPQQERRIDLPTIGPETVRSAAAAGLAGIGVAAGATLVLDRAEVVRLADAEGIFVFGLEDEAAA